MTTMTSLVCVALLLVVGSVSGLIEDEDAASDWMEKYGAREINAYNDRMSHLWAYYTNLTEHNLHAMLDSAIRMSKFQRQAVQDASRFDWQHFTNATLRRLFYKLVAPGATSETLAKQINELRANMTRTYSTAQVCDVSGGNCSTFEPDIKARMASSRDWSELVRLWETWRDVSGRRMKDTYAEFVARQNEAARENGYEDRGDQWRARYETPDFRAECDRLMTEIAPLYRQLHAYVRRKLRHHYSDHEDEFPSSGHIPAHILGNMWAQTWENVYDLVVPYDQLNSLDVTPALRSQQYDAPRMFRLAEEFFTSLGLPPMPPSFWRRSMLVKPDDGRDVVCHASAWDFYKDSDFRIKQCTVADMTSLITVHHEMGHVQYYLNYEHQHPLFREGANPGFHEAVGDVISLSVSTPAHLNVIGLLDAPSSDHNASINYLLRQALTKLAFLPFGFLIDQWRWQVFSGDVTPDTYNDEWWRLRCRYQGLSPPVPRSPDHFDPGSKFHVPNNTPYIRYFVSYVVQFQFHRALCSAAGHTGPLHTCDIYRSRAAGDKLMDMLALGSSRPWPEALEMITGQRTMSADAVLEYFQPLREWLEAENAGDEVGWSEQCEGETGAAAVGTGGGARAGQSLLGTTALLMLVLLW